MGAPLLFVEAQATTRREREEGEMEKEEPCKLAGQRGEVKVSVHMEAMAVSTGCR